MKRRKGESGYALVLVFLMAACVAIMLYTEVPRVAFEAERQREIQLVDRGNQFKRAIQVFVTDKTNNPTHRYPASLDELESFNNHRYLRRRYKDPMTGKDEWRLVHINGGVLTDSVTTQAPANGQSAASGSSAPAPPAYISQAFNLDPTAEGAANGGANRALNRRPSESNSLGDLGGGAMGGSAGVTGDAGGGGSGTPGVTGMGGIPGIPGQTGVPGQNGIPGQTGIPGISNPSQSQQAAPTCTVYIGSCPTTSATPTNGGIPQNGGIPGQGGMPGGFSAIGAGANGANMASAGGGPGIPGAQGSQNGAQSAAAGMINSLLTTPRPGGMPTTMPGAALGGGIAGVASKFEAPGIMVINERTKINEWEYIFDATKYRPPPNPLTGPAAMPAQGQTNGTPASQMGTMPPPPGQQQPAGPAGAGVGPGGGGGQ